MSMMRKLGLGDYQIGIWAVTRRGKTWLAEAATGTLRNELKFPTLRAAYLALTGEPRDIGSVVRRST